MKSSAPRSQQRGAALLLMMLAVLVTATTVLLTRLNMNDVRTRRLTDTQAVLARARDALIDYAVVRPDLAPGEATRLPCPDIDATGGFGEGETHTTACGAPGTTVIGRLPWKSLGIAPARDSSVACLWYVVSGSYKDAGPQTAAMINPDTNGQLQLWGIDAGAVIAGTQPDERPLALIIAPMPAINGQARSGPAGTGQCSASYAAADFLDADTVSGISNQAVSGIADGLDILAVAAGGNPTHNDRIAVVSRDDLARRVTGRGDYDSRMRALGLAAARCVADYPNKNPGGPADKRLPWPATVALTDYRPDAAYDDTGAGALSGRLPDTVDDSNVATGNSIAAVLSNCDPVAVAGWTPEVQILWSNWKDHFFYAVAESFAPNAPVPSNCATCLSVNGSGSYAAVLIFSDERLQSLGQVRNAPPTDVDTRNTAANYLEGANAANVPYLAGSVDFVSGPSSSTFNDRLFCIDAALGVTEC